MISETYETLNAEDVGDQAEIQSAPTEEPIEEDRENISDEINYAEILESDLAELRSSFPEITGISDITELKNPLRYGELRDLGLSAKEAYLASGGAKSRYDNRAHLTRSVPKGASYQRGGIPRHELGIMKDLFEGISERELERLYKKVTR